MDVEYASVYRELYRNHWWWRVRERILLSTIERLVTVTPIRILDVGCGDGLFFDALQRFGEVTGIEADAATFGEKNPWADRIIIGELDESFVPSHRFDLILLLDVIEHVPNARNLLRNAARLLKPTGRVLVTVPAFQWLWTRHDKLNHHVKRYTASDVRILLRAADLAPVETTYLFQSLILPKIAVRLAESLGIGGQGLPQVPSPTVNTALQAWFWTEYRILSWIPFGTSVLAVAGHLPLAPHRRVLSTQHA
jgi:SAM-dependent methyltransferase